jgi:hypothetical protein
LAINSINLKVLLGAFLLLLGASSAVGQERPFTFISTGGGKDILVRGVVLFFNNRTDNKPRFTVSFPAIDTVSALIDTSSWQSELLLCWLNQKLSLDADSFNGIFCSGWEKKSKVYRYTGSLAQCKGGTIKRMGNQYKINLPATRTTALIEVSGIGEGRETSSWKLNVSLPDGNKLLYKMVLR